MKARQDKVQLAENALAHLNTLEELLVNEGETMLGAQIQANEVHKIVMALRALKVSWGKP